MINTCPTCSKKTTSAFCGECNIATHPPLLPMELSKRKEIKDSISVGMTTQDNPRENIVKTHIGEGKKFHYDMHNVTYRFNIKRANVNFTKGSPVKMRNNIYRKLKFNGYSIRVYTKCLTITTKTRYNCFGDEALLETESNIKTELSNVMNTFCEENAFEVFDLPERISIEIKNLDLKTPVNFKTIFFKGVYPVDTPVEAINPKTATPDMISLSANYRETRELLIEMNENIQLEIQNKQLHEQVLREMLITQRKQQELLDKPTLLTKLKRWFNG